MNLHFDRARSLSLATVREATIVSDHEALLSAVRAGDGPGASALIAKHLNRYQVDEKAIREQYAAYCAPFPR